MFRGWLAMHQACEHCGLRFLREPGYFLGSIYFNYGLTTLLVTAAYLSLFLTTDVSPELLLWVLAAFCVLFPLWFFRYARALWLAMDLYFDPAKEESDSRPSTNRHESPTKPRPTTARTR